MLSVGRFQLPKTRLNAFTLFTNIRREITANPNQAIGSDFKVVYSFPFIKSFAIINKLKLYQTAATCVTIPASFAMSLYSICSQDFFVGVSAIGITGCTLLHTLGYLSSNTVGILYVHTSGETAKISYLDTWGSRRDAIVDIKDIVPFSEQARSITDPLYLKLARYSSKQKLKLSVRYGEVLDQASFQQIFLSSK